MIFKQNVTIYLLPALFIFVILSPSITRAETHVYSYDAKPNWTWNKEGSPYILEESVYIPKGDSLYINEGVDIMSASTTNNDDPYSLTVEGDLTLSGTEKNPVRIYGLNTLYFLNSNSDLENAVFDSSGLDFNRSTSTIKSVIIQKAFNAISAKGSHLNISDSQLKDNSYGIVSNLYKNNIFLMFIYGLIHKAMADIINDSQQNIISIHNSSIIDNINYGISNQSTNVINADKNWWGSNLNPENKVSGLVNTSPWLYKDPSIKDICCSNVVFLPGIEASRLYKGPNTLWEPNRNDDVKKLYMNEKGISIDSSISTHDILGSAYGVKDIYKSFISSMNGLVSDKYINNWLSIPYDWRKGAYDVVDNNFISKVIDIASTSKTGKISIIAHSNGGLVAKALVKKLEEDNKSDIVENILFIAVPELGTPQSLLSMLHGYSQSIAGGLILSKNNARTFSKDLPGAYGLLPSQKFFENNSLISPFNIITDLFSSTSVRLLSTYDEMKNFLINNSYSKTSSADTNIPIKLNPYLISEADKFHLSVDVWKPSNSSTKTLSIMGWGMPTTQGIVYENDTHCNKKLNKPCDIAFLPMNTNNGDGTVMTDSNSRNSDSTLFLNLKDINKGISLGEINHANILESKDLLAKVNDIILKSNTTSSSTLPKNYEKYFSKTEPIDNDKYLTIKVYSPIDIHVYDKNGVHTGPIDNPIPGKDLEPYEKNIKGSYYGDFDRVKIVQIPYDKDYQIILKGNDTGVFSADAQIVQNDKVIASTTFGEMPVTPSLNVDLIISSSTDSFASSSVMHMDVDGDGITDLINHSNEFLKASSTDLIKDISTYIESMRNTIIALKLPVKVQNNWLSRIDKINKILDKKHTRKAEKIIKKLSNKRFKNKVLSVSQKSAILITFEKLLSSIESENR